MCGIVGYTGAQCALDRLLDGLSKLEYRGCDCAGLSLSQKGQMEPLKAESLSALTGKTAQQTLLKDRVCGIGYTCWDAGGRMSRSRFHPHATARLSVVHSGILENYRELRELLSGKGYTFETQTDAEVATKLLDWLYEGDPVQTLARANDRLKGSYSIAALFADHPESLYGSHKNSFLAVGLGEGEHFLASDLCTLPEQIRDYYTLEPGEIACLSPWQAQVLDSGGNPLRKQRQTVCQDAGQTQKCGYEHFMLKEICEQTRIMEHTLRPRIWNGLPSFDLDALPEGFFARYRRIHIIACGTAMHAGIIGKDYIETMARIPVEVSPASEFRYRDPILPEGCLVLAISQSGETADTMAALRLAKSRGATILALVNVPGSSMAREADHVLYTHAGPEISVASTKAFMAQIVLLYLVSVEMARVHARVEDDKARAILASLLEAIDSIDEVLGQREWIRERAKEIARAESAFFIGRGLDWPMMMEGSLKLKEVTYIHSEAYAAGEFRHGAISLVAPELPVVALATQRELIPKMLRNVREIAARGSQVLTLCRQSTPMEESLRQRAILLPDLDDLLMPIPAAVALQLLAYYAGIAKGRDIDQPRNLTKSVTAE